MKMTPPRSGCLLGMIGFAVVCAWGLWSIDGSASSTASIAYVLLPIFALKIALFFFVFGLCAHYAVVKLRISRRSWLGYLCAMIALALAALFFNVCAQALRLRKTMNDVSKVVSNIRVMPLSQVETFLKQSLYRTNPYVLSALLERSDLSPEMLHYIAQIPSPQLHQRMGSDLSIMGKNKKKLFLGENRRGSAVMRLVARHPNVEARTLVLLAESPDPYVLGDVAGNAKTPVATLRELSRTRGQLMDWGLAANPNTPADILHVLAAAPDQYTRASVAANRNTGREDLEKLVQDSQWNVRVGIMRNPNCPQEIKERLRDDPDERIRRYFKK